MGELLRRVIRPEAVADPALSDFYAFLPVHRYIYAPTGELWPASSVDAKLPKQQVGAAEVPASAYLDRTRAVEQMLWHPGKPRIVEGAYLVEGGWVEHPGARAFNLYRPPPPTAVGEADKAEPWVAHVRHIYPDDAEHIIDYLAYKVQNPGGKVNHAIVLGGAQGIGKDTLLEPVRYALGEWNVSDVGPSAILGTFNGWVQCALAVISEARDLGGVDRYAFYERTKTYIAAPPATLDCNKKYTPQFPVANVMGTVITTNHRTGALFLPQDDRRHYVAWSARTKEEFAEDYWRVLWGWYGDGGRAHAAAYLRQRDLAAFDPWAPPPKTEAWYAMVDAERGHGEMALEDVLDDLGRPVVLTSDDIVARAEKLGYPDLVEQFTARAHARMVPHQMERAGYLPVPNLGAKDRRFKINGRRLIAYGLRSRARQELLEAIGELPILRATAGA